MNSETSQMNSETIFAVVFGAQKSWGVFGLKTLNRRPQDGYNLARIVL